MKFKLLPIILSAMMMVGCTQANSTPSVKPDEPPVVDPTEPTDPVENIKLTDATLLSYEGTNIKYCDGSATVGDVKFNWLEIGAYGNGMQMRTKDGKSSTITNENELPAAIKQIKISIHEGKAGYANEHALNFYVGDSADVDDGTIVWNTEKDITEYTLDVEVENCTYFKMVHGTTYSLYIDYIELVF